MKLRRLFHIGKSRKYPIKRDKEGLSLRARCFGLFEQGKRPVEVAEELKMNEATVCRYFRDWKRLGLNFELRYAFVKSLFNKTASDRDVNLESFARACGISKEQFEAILSQPHGLRRLLTGKFHFPAHADADHKRHITLELALLLSDHLIKNKGRLEDICFALKRYMREAKEYREEEDAEIIEENKTMALIHKILAKNIADERQGQVKPDKLSEKERNALIRFGIESEMKKTEIYYWLRIGILMAGGLTSEQAREKMYQDLLEKGDLNNAKFLRKFQDEIHPLRTNGQMPPPPPPETLSPS